MTTAPAPFIMAVLAVGGMIWLAMQWGYGRELSFLSRQIAEYKDKLGVTNPDQAKQNIDALEKRVGQLEETTKKSSYNITSNNQSGGITAGNVNVGRVPRAIDQSLRAQILAQLPRDKEIVVVGILGDAESINFAEQIHAFLKANGFKMKEPNGISQSVFTQTQHGLQVVDRGTNLDFIVGVNF
jgi:hypothetical protein